MREAFQGELTGLADDLAGMGGLATVAVSRATRALVEADLSLAELVITEDAAIHARARCCEDRASRILALQAPVAGDLRLIVSTIRIAEKLERMGDLARHVAELARLRHPAPVLPPELTDRFSLMGRLATVASQRVEDALAEPTGDKLAEQDQADDAIDDLQDAILDQVRAANPAYPMQNVIDATLLTRYYERFADQAVGITKNLDYLVTGRMPA
jgi:phosphate transport system protein